MNRTDALRVLRKAAAYQPTMRLDDLTEDAWAEALARYHVSDALKAVADLCGNPRPTGAPWLVTIGEIVGECQHARRQRIDQRAHLLQPPSDLSGQEYADWMRAAYAAIQEPDWEPPAKAIESAPDPRVGPLVQRLAAGTEW